MEGSSMKNGLHIDNRYKDKSWHLNDKLHREEGPTIEYSDGRKWWYLNGKPHRTDGPAIERADGRKEWYMNGKLLHILPQDVLINYMKANNYTLAHLLTDPDLLVRNSASKYTWKEVV
jgi:hypothetical protein